MSLGLRASLVALVVIPTFVGSIAAAETRDPAMATELFNAGRDLMKSGNYAAACPKLATSLALDAKVGTMARLAECEEHVGQLARARAHWEQAINLARTDGDPRLPKVEAEWKRLDGVVPKVDVEFGAPIPAGASLRVDSLDLGPASFGLPLPVDPGDHTIVVAATGKREWTATVHASPDGAVTRVEVPRLADAPPPPSSVVTRGPVASSPVAPSVPSSKRGIRIAAIATGGAGVAALGIGTAFGILASQKLADSNRDGCNGNACAQPGFAERNDARSAGDVSTGMFIAGGVLAAAGISLAVLSTRTERPLTVTAGAGSLRLEGTF